MTPRQRRLYREMVAAVRAWVRETHPAADRLTLLDEKEYGTSDQLAAFHAQTTDWCRGDMLAMRGRRN